MEELITSLMVEPGKRPAIVQLCNHSDFLRRAVSRDADWVCDLGMTMLEDGVVVLFNDEAVLLGLDGNRRVGQNILAGTFYVVGVKKQHLISLTAAQIVRYTARFWDAESYTYAEVLDAWTNATYEQITQDCSAVFTEK